MTLTQSHLRTHLRTQRVKACSQRVKPASGSLGGRGRAAKQTYGLVTYICEDSSRS
jgi:hypothetical protein